MSIKITAAALHKGIATVLPACERNASLPILQHTLVQASGYDLTLTATDLQRQISTTIPLEMDGAGVDPGAHIATDGITLPAHKLNAIASALAPDTAITIKPTEDASDQCTVLAERSRYRLQSLPGAEYPRLDHADRLPLREDSAIWQPKALLAVLDCIIPAMATKDVRYYLNGANLTRDGAMLHWSSTDGHRLHQQIITEDSDTLQIGSAALPQSIIIPTDTMHTLKKLAAASGPDEPISISADTNTLAVSLGATTLHSRLIDGNWPDLRRVIPTDLAHSIHIPREPLLAALTEMAVLQEDKSKGCRATFDPESVTLEAANAQQENATTTVAYSCQCTTLADRISSNAPDDTPDGVTIGFNLLYLREGIEAAGTDSVILQFTDCDKSIMIAPPGASDITIVVMPMRL